MLVFCLPDTACGLEQTYICMCVRPGEVDVAGAMQEALDLPVLIIPSPPLLAEPRNARTLFARHRMWIGTNVYLCVCRAGRSRQCLILLSRIRHGIDDVSPYSNGHIDYHRESPWATIDPLSFVVQALSITSACSSCAVLVVP